MEQRRVAGVICSTVLGLWAVPAIYYGIARGHDVDGIIVALGISLTAVVISAMWE